MQPIVLLPDPRHHRRMDEEIAPIWTLDELRYAGPEHLDPAFVAAYDRKQKYDPSADVRALQERGLDERSVVIDMGCGSGTFTMAVASLCQRVIAVDISPAMLEHLAQRVGQSGISNVECVRGGFMSYEHAGEPADFIFNRNALHQLPDFWKALALVRLAAMLKPGGTLWLRDLVYSFGPGETGKVFDGWFDAAVDDPVEGYTAADLAEHIRTEFSTFSWLLEPIIERAGFLIASKEFDRRRTYARYECLRI